MYTFFLPLHNQRLQQALVFYRLLSQWFEGTHRHKRDTFRFVQAVRNRKKRVFMSCIPRFKKIDIEKDEIYIENMLPGNLVLSNRLRYFYSIVAQGQVAEEQELYIDKKRT